MARNGIWNIKGQKGMCKFDEDECNSKEYCVWNHPGRPDCLRGEDCCSPSCKDNHRTILCKHFKYCTKRESAGGCPYRHPQWNSKEDAGTDIQAVGINGSSDGTEDERRRSRRRSTSGERRMESSRDDFERKGFVKKESRSRESRFVDKRGFQGRSKSQAGFRQLEKEEGKSLELEEMRRKKLGFRDFSKSTCNLAEILGTERSTVSVEEVSRSPERGGREDSRSSAWGDWGSVGEQQTFRGEAAFRRTGEQDVGRNPNYRGRGRWRGSQWTGYNRNRGKFV